MKRKMNVHKVNQTDSQFTEAAKDAEEFIFRECERLKIDFTRLSRTAINNMMKKVGCFKQYTDGLYQKKDAV